MSAQSKRVTAADVIGSVGPDVIGSVRPEWQVMLLLLRKLKS